MPKNIVRPGRLGQRVQLHRALSKLGWGSRGQAWDWIRSGQIRLDGKVVTDPLTWVDWLHQSISRGEEQTVRKKLTLALHKPAGVVVTRKDERGRKTVYDLLPADLPWVFPVGRLDADSEGLLILTNDSSLAVRLTEPEHKVPKTYEVVVRNPISKELLEKLRAGVMLTDGISKPVRANPLGKPRIEIVLTEGRNRQIRRMLAALGVKVRRLIRTGIGDLKIGDLGSGEHRVLTNQEIQVLKCNRRAGSVSDRS